MTSNNALVPDPDKFDVLASAPFDWPFQHLGLRMCGWGDSQSKYYLIGTPLIWQGSTISLFIAVLLLVFYLFRQQRKYADMEPRAAFHTPGVVIDSTKRLHAGEWDHFLYVGKIAFFGWFFHFGKPALLLPDWRDLTSRPYTSPVPHHGTCHLHSPLRSYTL
jgi:dolichyl-phosphate-mannose-protein mannosyltransferase